MPNPVMSSITLPVNVGGEIQNVTFDIKDAAARQMIENLGTVLYWIGVTTTELTDGASTNPITVGGESVTAKTGGIAAYGSDEFIFNGSTWQAFGSATGLGALAFKDSASGSYTPTGEVSQPTTTVNSTSTTVNSITDVGTLPSFTVSGETLVMAAGTLPTKGADQTVVADISGATTTQPTFTGTAANITVS